MLRNVLVGGTSLLLTVTDWVRWCWPVSVSCFLALRRNEDRDRPDNAPVEIDRLVEIQSREDRTAQNHLTAISVMKGGILRRLALRLTFYLISISAQKVFGRDTWPPSTPSISPAGCCCPATNRLMFFSNYGGSWESYLEDFVDQGRIRPDRRMEQHRRLSAHTLAVPRRRARRRRFKRWARRQQVPTLFWYSAYPDLNTARIRINSRIRRGIATATESEARDWLSLFGSTAAAGRRTRRPMPPTSFRPG